MADMKKSPSVLISWGELLDKVSILDIKASKIIDATARKNILKELAILNDAKRLLPSEDSRLMALNNDLRLINKCLWNIEDGLREKERRREFDAEFIFLARSVYKYNDRRARIKRHINDYFGSELVEEKLYTVSGTTHLTERESK